MKFEPPFSYNIGLSIEANILRIRRRVTTTSRKPAAIAWHKKLIHRRGRPERRDPTSDRSLVGALNRKSRRRAIRPFPKLAIKS